MLEPLHGLNGKIWAKSNSFSDTKIVTKSNFHAPTNTYKYLQLQNILALHNGRRFRFNQCQLGHQKRNQQRERC